MVNTTADGCPTNCKAHGEVSLTVLGSSLACESCTNTMVSLGHDVLPLSSPPSDGLCSWQRELHFRVESPTPNPQVAKCLTAPGRMSEDAALRPSSYIPPAASGPAEEPMPKPQPNGYQLGMARWQPGAGFWPWRGQSGQVCAGAQIAGGQAASRQPQAPAVPASSQGSWGAAP